MTAADVPLALSPTGVCNLPAGVAGRPGEIPPTIRAWRWDDVREVGVAGGWIFVNGARFCPDTGHVTPRELLALAKLAAPAREARLRGVMARWFRPVHLRRRARVLMARTRVVAALNAVLFVGMLALTVYVAGDFSARVPARVSAALANALPWLLLGLLATHVAAVVLAWRAVRRLKAVAREKRAANLFSALMLPPQALRLRTLAGEGFFPPQHPLAAVLAFGGERARREWAFNVVADLRWPMPVAALTPTPLLEPAEAPLPKRDPETAVAREVIEWFRTALERRVVPLLRAGGVTLEELLAAPRPDAPASCSYCPRCRDQFVVGARVCPHGIELKALGGRAGRRV